MNKKIVIITGTRKGIGEYLANYFLTKDYIVIGCSRNKPECINDKKQNNYKHYLLDVSDEKAVKMLFKDLRKSYGKVDYLINNAGVAAMNHSLLTPISSIERVLNTNVVGTFIFCREAAKLMKKTGQGRIVNFSTVAVPLKLEGESIYAASKAAIVSLTQIFAKELAEFGITVNAVGPTPIKTDLIKGVSTDKIDDLLKRQAIQRYGTFEDVKNVIEFFIKPESNFITGQVIYLGGI